MDFQNKVSINKRFQLKEKHARWFGILAIGLILPLVVQLGDGSSSYLHLAFVASIYSFFFWQGLILIIFGLRRSLPNYKDTQRRIIYSFLLLVIYTFLGGIVVDTILYSVNIKDQSCLRLPFSAFLQEFRRDFIITFTVSTIYETTYFFGKWKEALVQTEQLKNQHIRSQFEVLKNQVSPHFLFNSLNTLITLIPENPDSAVKFTENLSRVYRYILQFKDKELVSLATELEFIRSYVFLLKMRFGENLHIHYQIK
ncbi:MAG: histidine kinase, partial [Bacteroidota bacterium]